MRRIGLELARNINAVLVGVGFVALESGIALQWSMPVASIVGGGLLIAVGSWPYVVVHKRKP